MLVIESICMGIIVVINVLLERNGEKIVFVIIKGFGDILLIGNQFCLKIFDLVIKKLDVFYEEVVELEERVMLEDYVEDLKWVFMKVEVKVGMEEVKKEEIVMGLSGEVVRIL